MTRGIFVAGNESALFSAVGVEAVKRVERFAAAFISRGTGTAEPVDPQDTRRIVLDWNSGSPISARTLVLQAANRLEHIDNAVLVCVPPAYRCSVEGLFPADIDRLMDDNLKSWYFLVRELLAAFRVRKAGTLAMALLETGQKNDAGPDLVGPAVGSAFRSFAHNVLLSVAGAPYTVMGFSCSDPGEEGAFAAYIFKILDEGKKNSGKWHKYGKLGLFGR
jgi:NAD(P)-dependent dehydrogenase (short-subunit alcohol dehydrogenase family)